ncbi:cobalamin-5'-phosphate synthase [Actinopolyspora lacussalsi subsp. righensis]|uniref:Adenosylcobinamide-GDP ribazoletransferase n=1 Tax=Actinopolyspora righensis TaxID=995060 RepID=A0A1I7AX29_9ACTN|nr:adenosylcobinamide-GDP ribazoletransferase [Actinopolyspora righensis]SFT79498.1 cobalamin-5'-phosphate synthase [Actinopolyspora righensis]
MQGLRLAFAWLSVLPVRVDTVDDRTGRRAISFAPLVGAALGVFAALLLWALLALGAPALLAGLLTVAALALATRGMHIDGLADTVDGLGCYGAAERALSVMRDGSTGPFAVAGLVLTIGVQATGFAAAASHGEWGVVVLACAGGRAAFPLCCRRGIPAARQEGMGALVAGTQPRGTVFAWWTALLLAGGFATPGTWWVGLAAVVLTFGSLWVLSRHVLRRFGGVTGDVLGACCELGTTLLLAICALG